MGRGKSKSKLRKPNKQKGIPMAVASSPPALPSPPWTELPRDITANILQRLGAVEILESAQRVCTTWRSVSKDPAMWRVIDMNNFASVKVKNVCNAVRLAVDRSRGQLIDLSLNWSADDELLIDIVRQYRFCPFQISSKLRRLTLKSRFQITGGDLVEAVKRLPNLEELHLIMMPTVEAADVEVIGISCPMLNSFTFNEHWSSDDEYEYYIGEPDDLFALAIAKTMPNLRHLRLFANPMKNEGLEAILDGCPHLESLDIRRCVNLDLQGDLGKRCSEQIKSLKLPSDSISDIDWLPCDDSPLHDSEDAS